jgi:hypothetical protein
MVQPKKITFWLFLTILFFGCGGDNGSGPGTSFIARLDGTQETPVVGTTATGTGSFLLNPAKSELTFRITVTALSGPITAARFLNAPVGKPGTVVRTITADFDDNTATGVWKNTDGEPFSPPLVKELEEGRIYVNVNSAQNPTGEIRGQVNPIPTGESEFTANMDGTQETPPVSTPAAGTGTFSLNGARTELTFQIAVSGLSGPITGAHFHSIAEGGAIVRTLAVRPDGSTDFVNNAASGVWRNTDPSEPLSPLLASELEAGRIYVDIHTDQHPEGEIRGLIKPPTRSGGFTAEMDGAQETPAVVTTATGTGVFALNSDKTALTFDITVAGLSGAITQAHFHNAAAGVAGSIVRTLTADFGNNTASGVWRNTDGEPLSSGLVAALEAGQIYVNVHTTANPNGEIRGQLLAIP